MSEGKSFWVKLWAAVKDTFRDIGKILTKMAENQQSWEKHDSESGKRKGDRRVQRSKVQKKPSQVIDLEPSVDPFKPSGATQPTTSYWR